MEEKGGKEDEVEQEESVEALSEDLVLGHLICCRLRVRRKKVNLSLGQICHAMKNPLSLN